MEVVVSLRDQLLAKGLVSKKKARSVERELKQTRKAEQGSRKRKSQLAREEAEKARLAAEALLAEKAEARRVREAAQSVLEHAHRVRQLILGNRLGARGRSRFFFKQLDGHIGFFDVPEAIARKLRVGAAAIAALKEGETVGYRLITDTGARKLAELEPSLLAHWVTDTTGLADPSEQLSPIRDWEPSLVPHRVADPVSPPA